MRVPLSWLREYAPITQGAQAFADGMTMSGSKAETVERVGAEIANVVVGEALAVEKHPDADKLVVVSVNVGAGEPVRIVTGADNVTAGARMPVALHGAVLAGGTVIKRGKLRGVESNGMLCSIEELGATRADFPEAPEHGIYLFQEPLPEIGADAADALGLRDDVVEFEITSNRADCFSILGLAREAGATFGAAYKPPMPEVAAKAGGNAADYVSVEIRSKLCPRYIARVVKNVTIGPSPQWLRRRLSLAGLRPINNIVDITNYVMLEVGQPMHAFDIDAVSGGGIIVRNALDGERFTTLDGQERALEADMLVIADKDKALAIAGVMGGENSKVTGTASAILFESANFNGASIRRTAKRLGLRTDSSAKYEKGLDPHMALYAVNRAAQLVEVLGCGEVAPGLVDNYPEPVMPRRVAYTAESVNKLLGTDISAEEQARLLMSVCVKTEGGCAVVPTFRNDLEREADIAEEVARLYGYDKITPTFAAGTPTAGKLSRPQILEDMAREAMTGLGFCEALTYAFESPKVYAKLLIPEGSPLREAVTLANPLGDDFSVMRTTTANAMLTALSVNYNKRNESAALFELAKTYAPNGTDTPAKETQRLAAAAYGAGDFYWFKGVLAALCAGLGVAEPNWKAGRVDYLHPGRTAVCELGAFGEVHPTVLGNYNIGARAYLAELDLAALFGRAVLTAKHVPVPKFPAVRRDLAVVVKNEVTAGELTAAVRESGGALLREAKLFDVYTGAGVPEGHKSVAFGLTFRAGDRTLTDDEVTKAVVKVLNRLTNQCGAELRA